MSKLKDKYAKGKQSLEDRIKAKEEAGEGGAVDKPFPKASGPVHGSVTTMKIELQALEIEKLRAGSPSMKVSTAEVRPSSWANRHPDSFLTADFLELKKEIESAGGNIQPIKVRPINDGSSPGVKYEIVFGHRRYEACRQLDLPVLIMIGNLSDQSLFVEMDRENRNRKDLSPWEQGHMYKKAINNGLFTSIRKLAEAVGADPTGVSKAVSLADLPDEVVRAFKSPIDLQFRWAKPLKDALELNRDAVLSKAAELFKASPRLPSASVFAALTLPMGTPPKVTAPSVEVFSGDVLLAKMKQDKNGCAQVNFSVPISLENQQKLAEFIRSMLSKN